jgi:hypothetical protein
MSLLYSKSRLLKGITLALIMIALSVFCFLHAGVVGEIAGSIGIVMFGLGLIIETIKLFSNKPQITINSDGINDRRLNFGLIRWDEINTIELEKTQYATWVNINLNAPEIYYDKLPKFQKFLRKANGQIGINDFRIRLINLDKKPDEIWYYIEQMIQRFKSR